MKEPLWQPAPRQIQNSAMYRFMQWVRQQHKLDIDCYAHLHAWSVAPDSTFWRDSARFLEVNFMHLGEAEVDRKRPLWEQRWFADSRLNHAQNLLRYRDTKVALYQADEQGACRHITYAELYEEVRCVAGWLKRQGLQAGDRVAAFACNRIETVVAMLASSSLGLIWTSCSPDFGNSALRERFGQVQARVLFAVSSHHYAGKTHHHQQRLRELLPSLPSLEHLVWLPDSQGCDAPASDQQHDSALALSQHDWSALRNFKAEPLEFFAADFNHPLFILYSSGTTGAPKCIVHGHGGTLLQHRKEHTLHLDLKREDVLFYYTSCGWMMWNWLISALATGASLVLYDGSALHPRESQLYDLVDALGITVFGVSAGFISASRKAGLQPRRSHKLDSLRSILSTGSPLLAEGFDHIYQDVSPDVALQSISGGTDIISCFVLGNPLLPVRRGEIQCAGLGMDVAVLNEAGVPVTGEKGELVCRQSFPSMPVCFWNDSNNNRYRNSYFKRFIEQYALGVWTHGDYAEVTPAGGFIIYGRSDTVLNPGGVRIGTAEIYRVVEQFDEVLEAVAVGQQLDDELRILLFVRLADGIVADEALEQRLRHRLREAASPRHVPARILPVSDIPRTLSGKIAETAVRNIINGETVSNRDALANADSLEEYQRWRERLLRESRSR